MRGLWVQHILDVDGIEALCERAVQCGVTDFYVAINESGYSGLLCHSTVFQESSFRIEGQHALDYIAGRAAAHGIQAHTWVWPTWNFFQYRIAGRPSEWNAVESVPGWTDHYDDWLDFSNPDTRAAAIELLADLSTQNSLPIHLDYWRWPGATTKRFPDIVDAITTVTEEMKAALPNESISLAGVRIGTPGGSDGWNHDALGTGQTWPDWLERGLVDRVEPMNYHRPAYLQQLLPMQEAVRGHDVGCSITPFGWDNEPLVEPSEWEQMAELVRDASWPLTVFQATTLQDNPWLWDALEDKMAIVNDLLIVETELRMQAQAQIDQTALDANVLIAQADQIAQCIADLQAYDADADTLAAQAQALADVIE